MVVEAGHGDRYAELCEAAWAAFATVERLLEQQSVRKSAPLLYLSQTVQRFAQLELDPADTAELLRPYGPDGLSAAQALADVFASLCLSLHLVEEANAAAAGSATQFAQVALRRLEAKLETLVDLFRDLHCPDLSFLAVKRWRPGDFIASGDFSVFWRDHFPEQLRVRAGDFLYALRLRAGVSRGVNTEACSRLLPWLLFGRAPEGDPEREELEVVDLALLFDCFGMASGVTFCTKWEELLGHMYITAVCGRGDPGLGRAAMCAADIAQSRREQLASVLLPGWSRDKLRENRPLMRVLTTLGMSVACDADEGLLVTFAEPEVAACLVPPADRPPSEPPIRLGAGGRSRLAEAATEALQDACLADVHFEPAGTAPSRCLRARLDSSAAGDCLDHHTRLTELKRSRIWVLNDFLSVLEVLGARQRRAAERRLRLVRPGATSGAVPKMQQALKDQQALEEELNQRRQALLRMEQAYDDPDQIAHVRALMQDVAEAELEMEQSRKALARQTSMYRSEDETFQQTRNRQDLAWRQRVAAVLIEMRLKEQQRLGVRSELSRIEVLLLDLEENFSSDRQRLHDYDERLCKMIQDKQSFLEGLVQAASSVRAQIHEADAATLERAQELEGLRRVMELQANKARQLEEIDTLEKKLGVLASKSAAVAAAAVGAA